MSLKVDKAGDCRDDLLNGEQHGQIDWAWQQEAYLTQRAFVEVWHHEVHQLLCPLQENPVTREVVRREQTANDADVGLEQGQRDWPGVVEAVCHPVPCPVTGAQIVYAAHQRW